MSDQRSADDGATAVPARDDREPFRILFVCTGNTCRSPLAEALARRGLQERGWDHVSVESAGIATTTGLPASEGSRTAARERGLDLSDHESAQLTEERVDRADLILAMTPSHVADVEARGGEGKVALLGAFAAGAEPGSDGGGGWAVPDPFGGDPLVYRETLAVLERMVEKVLARLEAEGTP